MTTATRQEIRETMVDTYKLGRRGTNTGTVATSATDATFARGGAHRIEVDCAIMPTSGGTAPEDEERFISSRPTSAGLMSVLPVFTEALADNDTFTVLYRPLRFPDAHTAINWALRNIFWEKLLLPITLVSDGDMLESGTTSWSGGVDATAAKLDATFPHGLHALTVLTSGAGGYIGGSNIAVEPGASYYVEATGAGTTTATTEAGTLVLRDITNEADISMDNVDINTFEPQLLVNASVTMPSGCEKVSFRLTGTGASDSINFSNIILRKNDSKEFFVQDRGATVDRLGKLYATTSDVWGARGDTRREVAHTLERRTAGLWVYKTRQSLAGKSLWYEEWRRPVALTNDSTLTVSLDKEDVAAVATEHLLKTSGLRREDNWRDVYDQAVIDAARVRAKYQSMERSYDFSPTTVVLAET